MTSTGVGRIFRPPAIQIVDPGLTPANPEQRTERFGPRRQARSVSPGEFMPIQDALYGYSLRTLNAAAASCQMHLKIFFAVIVGKFFARLYVTEREKIHTTLADIDLAIRRAGVVDKAGCIRRYVPVDHARIARPKKVLPAILFYLLSCGGASEVFDDA